MLLPEGVQIGERAMCPSLGSPDEGSLDSEVRHVSSGEGSLHPPLLLLLLLLLLLFL